VIDNPEQVERLLGKLTSSLPLAAITAPELAAFIRREAPDAPVPRRCNITWVGYTGDEGGILCKLDIGRSENAKGFFVSITHLIFDARSPLAREIAAYQKHRTKRLRRAGSPTGAVDFEP
jgi:hypothetical protein